MAHPHFDAIFLDAGGVLVAPLPHRVLAALGSIGVHVEADRLLEAHYSGMHAVDRARSDPEHFGDYYTGYLDHLGVDVVHDPDVVAAASAALDAAWREGMLWCHPVPGAAEGLAAIAASGLPIVVVSNADGTVQAMLEASGLLQVGPGTGAVVEAVVDSGLVGVTKPDPAIFELALDLVGASPDRVLHVGDAYTYDVVGARSAGLQAALVDPLDLRPDLDCHRLDTLHQVARLLA